jgi:hypothetical protein
MRRVRYSDLAVRFTFSNVVIPENEEENLSRNVEENIRGIQSMNISDPADQNGQNCLIWTQKTIFYVPILLLCLVIVFLTMLMSRAKFAQ